MSFRAAVVRLFRRQPHAHRNIRSRHIDEIARHTQISASLREKRQTVDRLERSAEELRRLRRLHNPAANRVKSAREEIPLISTKFCGIACYFNMLKSC